MSSNDEKKQQIFAALDKKEELQKRIEFVGREIVRVSEKQLTGMERAKVFGEITRLETMVFAEISMRIALFVTEYEYKQGIIDGDWQVYSRTCSSREIAIEYITKQFNCDVETYTNFKKCLVN
jgi:hypothetical protein